MFFLAGHRMCQTLAVFFSVKHMEFRIGVHRTEPDLWMDHTREVAGVWFLILTVNPTFDEQMQSLHSVRLKITELDKSWVTLI